MFELYPIPNAIWDFPTCCAALQGNVFHIVVPYLSVRVSIILYYVVCRHTTSHSLRKIHYVYLTDYFFFRINTFGTKYERRRRFYLSSMNINHVFRRLFAGYIDNCLVTWHRFTLSLKISELLDINIYGFLEA